MYLECSWLRWFAVVNEACACVCVRVRASDILKGKVP